MTGYLLLSIAVAVAALSAGLAALALVARRQHLRDHDQSPTAATLLDHVDDLATQVEAVSGIAEQARAVADEANHNVTTAEHALDRAEGRYRQARFAVKPPPADDARRLVERAALEAYSRGDLSAAQLDAIWRQSEPAGPPAPAATEAELRAARSDMEQAESAAAQARRRAATATLAAAALTAEQQASVYDLEAAQHQATAGLPGLLSPADPPPAP